MQILFLVFFNTMHLTDPTSSSFMNPLCFSSSLLILKWNRCTMSAIYFIYHCLQCMTLRFACPGFVLHETAMRQLPQPKQKPFEPKRCNRLQISGLKHSQWQPVLHHQLIDVVQLIFLGYHNVWNWTNRLEIEIAARMVCPANEYPTALPYS